MRWYNGVRVICLCLQCNPEPHHGHNLFRQIDLAGQGALFERHVEQRPHFPHDHGAERAFQRDPQAAGFLIRGDFAPLVAARQETGGAGGQRQFVVVPEQDDASLFHREPDPLVVGVQGPGSLIQHDRAGGGDPRAAGLGQASGLVVTFHREGGQMFRDLFQ